MLAPGNMSMIQLCFKLSKGQIYSAMQVYDNEFAAKSKSDGMHLEESKDKEPRISLSPTNS